MCRHSPGQGIPHNTTTTTHTHTHTYTAIRGDTKAERIITVACLIVRETLESRPQIQAWQWDGFRAKNIRADPDERWIT